MTRRRRAMSPANARLAALRKFGNVGLIEDQTRAVWRRPWIDQLLFQLAMLPGGFAPAIAAVVGLPAQLPVALRLIMPIQLTMMAVIASPVVWGEEFGWRGYLQRRWFVQRPLHANAIGIAVTMHTARQPGRVDQPHRKTRHRAADSPIQRT